MSQSKTEQTRLVIHIKTVWLAVRFNCKLSFLLKNDVGQVIANSDFTYPLTRGQAQVNDILTYTAPINILASQKFKVFVIMVSANGMVPAGFVSLSLPTRQFGTSLPTTLSLERCQDMRAQIKLTIGLDDGTKNLLLVDQDASIQKQRLSQIKRISSPMNQLNYLYSPANRASNSAKKQYNMRYSKRNQGSAIKILKEPRPTENEESGNNQPLLSISKEQLVKEHQEFWVEIVKLQGQNQALKEDVKEIKEKNLKLQNELKASNLENQSLLQQYQSLKEKYEVTSLQNLSLLHQNQSLRSEKASILATNQSLLTQRNNIISQNDSYRNQNSSLEAINQKLKQQNEKIVSLVFEVEEGKEKIINLQRYIKEQKFNNERLDEQYHHLEQELEQAKLNIKTLLDLNAQLQQTSDLQKNDIKSTNLKLKSLQSQHHEALEKLEHSQKNISQVALQKQELLLSKNQIDQNIKQLKSEKQQIEQKIIKSEKEMSTLHQQKEQLLLAKCSLQIDNKAKDEQIRRLMANIQSINEEKNIITKTSESLQIKLKQTQQNILMIQQHLQESSKESALIILQNNQQIEELKLSLNEKHSKNSELEGSYSTLQIKFLQITKKFHKSEETSQSQLALISQLNQKYNAIEQQFQLMNQLVMKQQEQKQKLRSSFGETENLLSQSHQQNSNLLSSVKDLEQQLKNLELQLSQLNTLLKSTEEDKLSFEDCLKKSEEKNAALVKEINSLKDMSSLNESKLIIAEQQVQEAHAQIYSIRMQLSEIESKKSSHKEYQQKYNLSLTELTLKQAKLEHENADLHTSLNELSSQVGEYQERLQAKQKQLAELKTFTHAKLQENLKLRKEKEQLSAKIEGK